MPDVWIQGAIATKFLLYLGVLTAAGSAFAALIFRTSDVKAFASIFSILGLIGACMGFLIGGATLMGDASGMYDREILGLLWSTPVGTALSYRLVGLGLLVGGFALGMPGLWISSLGGVIALWSFVTVGHVPDQDVLWINMLLLLHLVAISLWIGILTPLRRLCITGLTKEVSNLGHRFGRAATVFVPLLILAGLVMSYRLVGSINALLTTGYGQALIAKVMLVGALLGLAAHNKLRLIPMLLAGETRALHQLSRSISLEWIAVALILLITAILTSTLNVPS